MRLVVLRGPGNGGAHSTTGAKCKRIAITCTDWVLVGTLVDFVAVAEWREACEESTNSSAIEPDRIRPIDWIVARILIRLTGLRDQRINREKLPRRRVVVAVDCVAP